MLDYHDTLGIWIDWPYPVRGTLAVGMSLAACGIIWATTRRRERRVYPWEFSIIFLGLAIVFYLLLWPVKM